MDYVSILKRAWKVTWEHKALWVLGIFAGVSGCTFGGGTGGDVSTGGMRRPNEADLERLADQLQQYLPLIAAVLVFVIFLSFLFWIFAVAARGGLVVGVSACEEGTPRRLGELWQAGFARFWSLVGIDVMLSLPLIAVALAVAAMILVPLAATVFMDGEPGPELAAPLCGSLVIGVPLLLVGTFVFGILRLIAQRYVMLGGQGAVEATVNAWRFFRARFVDSAVMWLLNAVLNIAAAFALAIPVVAIGIAVAVPLAVATRAGIGLGGVLALAGLLLAVVGVIALAFNAVWGTFTSALWTVFFRDVTGMTARASAAAPIAGDQGPVIAFAPSPDA